MPEQIQNKLIREVKEIPPLPDVVVKVMQLTRDPNVSAKQLTDTISMDQGLTTNILRLCNSAYYGIPRVISSLTQAIMYLGFHTVRNLVLTLSLDNLFNTDDSIYGFEQGGLWYHSVSSAMISELVCKRIKPEVHDTAFTAGLLHSMGQLIIGIKIKDSSETIIELMQENGINQIEAEREVCGISHPELGAMLAEQWNFPDDLVYTIRYYREPDVCPHKSILPSVVHVAVSMSLDLEFGLEIEAMKYEPQQYAIDQLNIDQESIEIIKNLAKETVEENAPIFLHP